ncbi:hypothetical protein WJX81_005881 [Elliptochloris bilobata]|uniref:USP domain-containing protein n=1 Tax=Elliptochloris bilobata TaxID=381761 RepID=A0AAW1SB31_9CHLO
MPAPEPRSREEEEGEREAALAALPCGYYEPGFDPVAAELGVLRPAFAEAELEEVVEARSAALEVVSERLSAHVLARYDSFIAGVDEVASVEADLGAAHRLARSSRAQLSGALIEVGANLGIARSQRRRQGLAAILGTLQQMRGVTELHEGLRAAQDGGDFAGAFWLCAQCARALAPLAGLRAAAELGATVGGLYEEGVARLEAALQAVCADFRAPLYASVLEGYVHLGNVAALGEEVMAAFAAVVNSAALKVARGVLLARPGVGAEVRSSQLLQELVRQLPSDQFRTCLSQVLMVIFDILASHHAMVRWHAERLEQRPAELAALCEAREDLEVRLAAAGGAEPPGRDVAQQAGGAVPVFLDDLGPRIVDAGGAAAHVPAADLGGGGKDDVPDTSGKHSAAPAEAEGAEVAALRAELAALAEKEREEGVWGKALERVAEGLSAGRRWLWDEAARRVGILLAAPAAFEGEHFLQVLEWTQAVLAAGEAFSGSESATLRDALQRQSGRFFAAYHAANMQALHAMLEREVWRRLPLVSGPLPSVLGALEGAGAAAPPAAFDSNDFGAWVARGNPWRETTPVEDSEDGAARLSGSDNPSLGTPDPDGGGADCEDDEEAAELYGESIDEENQRVRVWAGGPRRDDDTTPVVTNASWRLARWLAEYAQLMRILRSDAGRVWSGAAELFELYFLHTYAMFADVGLMDVLGRGGGVGGGGGDAVPARLRNALARILARSLPRFRPLYLPRAGSPGTGPPGGGTQGGGMSGGAHAPGGPEAGGTPLDAARPTPLCHPGNMHGLLERKVAADALLAVAGQLAAAQQALVERLVGRADVPQHHTPDAVFQAVKAAADVRDALLRAAARANLPVRWLPERLAEQNFNLEEPPTRASPWVVVLLSHLQALRQRLEAAGQLSAADVEAVWRHACHHAAEMVLEGIARAGAAARCTAMGRSAMSLDLQVLQRGIAQAAGGGPRAAEAAADALRLVDAYVKAFYLPEEALSGQCPVPLVNLGNTCYFNSALQVLASVPAVHQGWCGADSRLAVRGALGGAFAEFLKASGEAPVAAASAGGRGGKACSAAPQPFNPHRLHAAVLKIAPQLKGGEEEDSHELMRILLDGLEQEELRARSAVSQAQASAVERVFGGQLASRVACTGCGHEAATSEPFLDISVGIPQAADAGGEELGGKGKRQAKRSSTADDAKKAAKATPALTAKARKRQAKIAGSAVEQERRKARGRKAASLDADAAAPAQPISGDAEAGEPEEGDQNAAPVAAPGSGGLSESIAAVGGSKPEDGPRGGGALEEGTAENRRAAAEAGEPGGKASIAAGRSSVDAGTPSNSDTGTGAASSHSMAGGVPTLEACIASFFAPEPITWVCPAETAARKGAADGHSRGARRRSVSFSGEQPRVKLIPGSWEQRGTDFVRALRGETPFCRTVALGDGGRLLVTADVEAGGRAALILGLHPHDISEDVDATLPDSIELASVPIPPVSDSEDESEQVLVQAQAQALMDAVADMVTEGGVERARRLASPKAALRLTRAASGAGWRVNGECPAAADGLGGGAWAYVEATGETGAGGVLTAVQRAAEKQYRVRRAPAVLTVHLKRFQQNARGRLRKIEGAVVFPLHLDLSAGGKVWWRVSDTQVRAVDWGTVARGHAYLLIYAKDDAPAGAAGSGSGGA